MKRISKYKGKKLPRYSDGGEITSEADYTKRLLLKNKSKEELDAQNAWVIKRNKKINTEVDIRQTPTSGIVVDKRTNIAYAIGDDGTKTSFNVLTGKNPDLNWNKFSMDELDNNPNKKNTPVGYYKLERQSSYIKKGSDNDKYYNNKYRTLTPIAAYGQGSPQTQTKESEIGFHRVYSDNSKNPNNPEYLRRSALLEQTDPTKRNASYGCVNCEDDAYDEMNKMFPKGDTLMVVDSKNPKDKELLRKFNNKKFAIGGEVDTYQDGRMIKRADGSYSKRGLWDNIRANAGSGKTPTAEMLKQEAKINKMAMGGYMMYGNGGTNNPGFDALPEEVQQNILANMAMGGQMNNPMFANGGKLPQDILESRLESHMSTDEVNDYLDEYGEGGYVVKRSSDRKGKTHVVIGPDGTKKYFGDPNMGQKEDSKNGKEAFYARHKTNLANNPYFRAYARKTWAMGGMNMEQEIDPKPATSSTKTFNNIVPLVDPKTGKPNWDNYYSTLDKMGTNVESTNPEAKQTSAQSAINHYIGQGIVPQIKTYQLPLNTALANKYGKAFNPTTGPTTDQFLDSAQGAAALGSPEAYQDFLNNTKAYNAYRGKTQIPPTDTTGTSDPNAEMYGARYYNMFTPGYTAPLPQQALGGQFAMGGTNNYAMGGMTMKQGIIHAPEMGGYFRKK